MIRELIVGFVDYEALAKHELLIRKPLDRSDVEEVIREMGEISPIGNYSIGGYPIVNYGTCLSFSAPIMNHRAIDLIQRLVEKTGCDVADYEFGFTTTPDELHRHCDLMLDLRKQAPPA